MVNQKYTNQVFQYVLLLHCTILVDTADIADIVDIVDILETYVKNENHNNNSMQFSKFNRNAPIEDDKRMVSFGVIPQCTSIAIAHPLNIIKYLFLNNDHFTSKTPILQDKFLNLQSWS